MANQIVYVLIHPDGTPNFYHCSYLRDSVERSWLELHVGEKNNTWKSWLKKGFEIKKVEITIKLI